MLNDDAEYSPPASMADAFAMRKKSMNRRRFSEEQIKSLESIFESESRLEPRKKLQLAGELGLHPRQVAIWFQNKRARWKSKQLERDYSVLRANYNTLASRFEALKKEKQALTTQVFVLCISISLEKAGCSFMLIIVVFLNLVSCRS